MTNRVISLAQARAQYPHRFTMDHVPAWARKACGNGKHYAPQFVSNAEWYAHTRFPGESGCYGRDACHTTGQTWPLGQWLDRPYVTGEQVGYLQHGAGTAGPFRTERVRIKERGYPHPGQWLAYFEGLWRVVHVQVRRTFIVYRGERIDIQIWGV